MSKLIALDTETTGLDPDTEDVFEVALVDLDPDGGTEHVWRLRPRDNAVANMHPKAAEVNRYWPRTADPTWRWDDPLTALTDLAMWLDGAHIVDAVPDFDTRHLTALYKRAGFKPPRWHYHLIDIEAMAVGYIYGREAAGEWNHPLPDLPWSSDELSRACGIEPPTDEERHTALGDARWVARWYRALAGGDA